MRTAIFLLLGILLIVLIGSFVPQQNTSDPGKVEAFLTAWPNLNVVFADLQLPLTQVFVSPVFYVLLGLLYVSLGWCVIRRGRALIMRTLRGYQRTPQYWGEWGSWLFHSSFFLLLIAVVWGKATGYQGLVALTEGQSFTNTPSGYDTLQQGLLFSGNYAPFTVASQQLRGHIRAPTARPATTSATSASSTAAGSCRPRNIRVNDFLSVDGVNVYQQDYGWAPTIVVKNPAGRWCSTDRSSSSTIPATSATRRWATACSRSRTSATRSRASSQAIQIGAKMSFFPDATLLPSVGSNGVHRPDSHDVRSWRGVAAQPGASRCSCTSAISASTAARRRTSTSSTRRR